MQRTPTCRNCCRNYSFKALPKQSSSNLPLLLDCAHTFCEGCLTKLARAHKTHIPCPDCDASMALTREGPSGVKELSINVYIMGILATNIYKMSNMESSPKKSKTSKISNTTGTQATGFLHSQKKASQPSKIPALKCEECFSASATSRCVKCECVFCGKCFEKVHSMSHTLRKHKPMPLISSSVQATSCSLHNNRPLEFYDKEANKPVCAHCLVTGDREMNSIVPIADMSIEIEKLLQDKLNDGKTVLKHLENSQQKVQQVLTQNQLEKTILANEIREHFQCLSSTLQVREKFLVQQVEKSQCPEENLEMSIAESIRKARTLLIDLEDTLSSPTTLISRCEEFTNELQKLQEMDCFAVKTSQDNQALSMFHYDTDDIDLLKEYGRIQEVSENRLEMKKVSEITQDDMETEEESVNDDNVSLTGDQEEIGIGKQTHASRRLLSIPYRHELVQVTHIKSPSSFVVQRIADMDQINAMMNSINKWCEFSDSTDLVFEVNLGDMVCAQFTGDNHWYRARVITIYSSTHPNTLPTLDNKLTIQVLYVDYGNTEWIPLIRLRTMPTKFLHIPDFAVSCCLNDIVPPFQQVEWPPKTLKAFGSLTRNKTLLMTAIQRGAGGVLHVDLKCPDDEEPTQDDDRPASVRDALVFLEVAKFKSQASQIRTQGQQAFPMRVYKHPPAVDEGQRAQVYVTHVNGPDDLYIQIIEDNSSKQLLQVMDEMYKLYTGKQKRKDLHVLWPYRGLVCSAQFTEDKAWYRALVLAVNSDDSVDVNYVDYGNSERLPFSALRKLPDSLLELPQQARRASMADLKDPSGSWPEKVQQFVSELLIGRTLTATITSVNDDVVALVLYDQSTHKDTTVNQLLVQSHLAVPAGLGIVKDVEEDDKKSVDSKDVEVEEIKEIESNITKDGSTVESTGESQQESSDFQESSDKQSIDGGSMPEEIPRPSQPREEPSPPKPSPTGTSPLELSPPRPIPSGLIPSSPSSLEEKVPISLQSKVISYKPASVPVNKQFQAEVTYVCLEGYIYVQELKPGVNLLVKVMSGLITNSQANDKAIIPTGIDQITIGQPCCAYFSGDELLYRAMVTKVISNDTVEVNYIDFGNSDVVSLSAIRLISADIDVPKQCLKLALYGVQPANRKGKWSLEAVTFLSQLIVGKTCSVIIEGGVATGKPIEARLCTPEGTNVSDQLISQGFARPLDNSHVKESNVLPAGITRAIPGKKGKSTTPSRAETKLQARLIGAREAEQLLPSTTLPEVNMSFDVMVTHVDRPDHMFIQRSPNCDSDDVYDIDPTLLDVEDELERLEDMQLNINKPNYFKKYEPLKQTSVGMLCCGKYTEDDTWYRCQVLTILSENPLKALVRYIDYGNTEELVGDRMRGFPSELLDLPVQATLCKLAHVIPPKTAELDTEGAWPEGSRQQLINFVVGRRLEARIKKYGPPMEVELTDVGGDQNIAKKLAELGHAIYQHGTDSLDSMSEGAPSSCGVEMEDEESVDSPSSSRARDMPADPLLTPIAFVLPETADISQSNDVNNDNHDVVKNNVNVMKSVNDNDVTNVSDVTETIENCDDVIEKIKISEEKLNQDCKDFEKSSVKVNANANESEV